MIKKILQTPIEKVATYLFFGALASIILFNIYRLFVPNTRHYNNGNYCATVEYFNPNTEKESKYVLTVKVENQKLIKIYFNNGGWLDESHFTAPLLDANGNAIIIDDRGYEYVIGIFKDGNCSKDEKVEPAEYF